MVNLNKLKGRIVERGMNVSDLSALIGIDKATFYRKMNSEGKNFTIEEADSIARELKLNCDEVNSIFFSQFVADMRI